MLINAFVESLNEQHKSRHDQLFFCLFFVCFYTAVCGQEPRLSLTEAIIKTGQQETKGFLGYKKWRGRQAAKTRTMIKSINGERDLWRVFCPWRWPWRTCTSVNDDDPWSASVNDDDLRCGCWRSYDTRGGTGACCSRCRCKKKFPFKSRSRRNTSTICWAVYHTL